MIKNIVNLGDAAIYCDFGSEVNQEINSKVIKCFKILKDKNLINKKYSKLKILGTGELKTNIDISAHFASKQASEKIQKAGGKLNLIKK